MLNFSKTCLYFFFLATLLIHCKTIPVKRELKAVHEIASVNPQLKYLKVHMKDGTVFILQRWEYDSSQSSITGYGKWLDINRKPKVIEKSNVNTRFAIPTADVSLLETNDIGPSLNGGLIVVTGISLAATIYCIANPKACFGSCPTFYAPTTDSIMLQAEGFSTSVAPSLEKNDIDMLYHAKASKEFELLVTNEALETHSIRYANLLVFEKQQNERIFVSPNEQFYKISSIQTPVRVTPADKDILSSVSLPDGKEYFSLADENDLATKEEIEITIPSFKCKQGLIIGKRQTLLTTYLFYQGLAYMGNTASYWLAELERGKVKKRPGVLEVLGGIEIYLKDKSNNWVLQNDLRETGPIATDYNIIPLDDTERDEVMIKIRMNKGLWRIDYLALAKIDGIVSPALVEPYFVETITGTEPDPLGKLLDESQLLVAYPGDAYRLRYDLPYTNCEIFLDSKGYYLEWMRDDWVKEQNLMKLHQMMRHPETFLRRAAPDYKKLEPSLEDTFWKSRYAKH